MSRDFLSFDVLAKEKPAFIKPPLKLNTTLVVPEGKMAGAVKGIGRWIGNICRFVASDDPYQEGGISAATGWANTKCAFALE